MNKRSLLAVFLLTFLFVAYQYFNPPPSPKSGGSSPETQGAPETQRRVLPGAENHSPQSNEAPLAPEELVEVSTGLYDAVHSSHNASLKSFSLKNFRQTSDPQSPLVNLFEGESAEHAQNLKLVFPQANFSVPSTVSFQKVSQSDHSVVYRFENSEIVVTKTLQWNAENYSADIQVMVENRSSRVLQTGLGLHLEAQQHPEVKGSFQFLKGPQNLKYPAYFSNQGIQKNQDVKNLGERVEQSGVIQWVALEDRYFLLGLISRISAESKIAFGKYSNGGLYSELLYPLQFIPPSGKIERTFSVYAGPKQVEFLKKLNVSLEESVDYGWLSWIAHPILWLLKFFHGWVGNWGLAIIALTLTIKLLLHPINKRSLDSMKAMQKIQPQLAKLKEKYGTDRERMNTEMMALFKTNKINPLGGCLPMVLQMPVYFALYRVLYNAIELYHAPFVGFYKDLSAPDPYFILPVLLGIFMVLQQKLTPSPTQDPTQARMMMLMPILFSAFMLFLPVGLVIYIFVNTSTTVVQQYLHQHDMSFMDLVARLKKS